MSFLAYWTGSYDDFLLLGRRLHQLSITNSAKHSSQTYRRAGQRCFGLLTRKLQIVLTRKLQIVQSSNMHQKLQNNKMLKQWVKLLLLKSNFTKLTIACFNQKENNSDNKKNNSSDGRVVRASASGAVDLGLIPIRVKPMTLKLVFTASLLDDQH